MFAAKRLGKELNKAQQKLPPGITLVKADNLKEWQMDIEVLDANPLYMNQIFRLSFIFNDNYPIEAPEVTFLNVPSASTASSPSASTPRLPISNAVNDPADLTNNSTPNLHNPTPSEQPKPTGRPIPIHPHVYSNGIICLDLLGTAGWSPVQSVESVCMSIQSMLTGNTKNERPQGDEAFCRSMGPRGPDGWSGGGGRYGRGGRGLKDIRFAYDDDTV